MIHAPARCDDAAVDKDVERLITVLEQLRAMLREAEPRWANWIAEDVHRIQRGDGSGVSHFLAALGGMGSLNDVVFLAPDDEPETVEETRALNERFRTLLSEAYALAASMRHDAEEV